METRASLFTPVLIGGCIIIMLGFSIRASFGVFQIPIAQEFGWPRAEFSLAIAIQNLAWGIGQPIFVAMLGSFGKARVSETTIGVVVGVCFLVWLVVRMGWAAVFGG